MYGIANGVGNVVQVYTYIMNVCTYILGQRKQISYTYMLMQLLLKTHCFWQHSLMASNDYLYTCCVLLFPVIKKGCMMVLVDIYVCTL